MIAIEEMAGMDVLYSDKTGTLTLNKLSVNKNLIEVFAKGVDKGHVLLLSARASRTENQDAIDAAMVGMLADAKEARAGIREVHFLPFKPVDKRTALTYIEAYGSWHCASKGAPEQVGDAMKKLFDEGVMKREDLRITSKLWCSDQAPEDVSDGIDKTLEELQLNYVDLYLIIDIRRARKRNKIRNS